MGIPRERWIFPLAVVESNHMAPLCVRRFIDRSPGFACAGRRLVELAGVALDAVDHVELYSCFPAAVRLQLRALGLRADRPLTVTGGMPFAGGPLNNFVLQALARMAEVLRATPGATGLVSAVSGIINKQGLSLWQSGAPARPFAYDDVAAEVAGQLQTVSVRADGEGPGTVASYTVLYEGGAPRTGVALVDFSGRERTIATTDDASIVAEMLETEFCGRTVRVASGGRLTA
jgi:acetyl-CoA C-acetyltransferase